MILIHTPPTHILLARPTLVSEFHLHDNDDNGGKVVSF